MDRSLKAVLLSTLLYPGSGHFFLKKKLAGCIFIVLFSTPLFFLLNEIITKTNQVIAQIETGHIPFDIVSITAALTDITSGNNAQALTIKIYFMTAIWIISALDAYRLSRHQETTNQ